MGGGGGGSHQDSNHIKVKGRIHSLLCSPVMIAIQDLQVIMGPAIKPQGLLAKKSPETNILKSSLYWD